MKFKIPSLDIPLDDPFKFDALKRRESIETLSKLIDNLHAPFVLAINSPWGTGKSTFLKIWQKYLESNNYHCIYFNAWETDFTADPLVALLGEISQFEKGLIEDNPEFNARFDKVKTIAALLAKRALPVMGKVLTAGILDLDEVAETAVAEAVGDGIKDVVAAYETEKTLIAKFHTVLSDSIEVLKTKGGKEKIIIFVDEMDRCRPTYSIELLERIKHLFNIDNIIFILALDKKQLGVSLNAVYGNGINGEEYLRRFIDLEFLLPAPNTIDFTKSLVRRFEFNTYFAERTNSELVYDLSNLIDEFSELADVFKLTLRAREQCFTLISLAMLATPKDHYFYPQIIAILAILKICAPSIYQAFCFNGAEASTVMEHIKSYPLGPAYLKSTNGIYLESTMIMLFLKSNRDEKSNDLEQYKLLASQGLSEVEKQRVIELIRYVEDSRMRRRSPTISFVTQKIEILANVK